MPFPATSPHIRFWNHIEIPEDYETGCWIWTAQRNHFGYGIIYQGTKMLKAHRVSYEIHYGDIPEGEVRHSCHNPSCVSPHHLSIGTKSDNMRDMIAAGRGWNQKLSHAQVLEIQALKGTMSRNELAKMFGVSKALIDKKLSPTFYHSSSATN